MKFLNTLLITAFAGGLALAAPPQNHRADRYKDLYLKSAITDPPVVIEDDPEVNDLPDWVLVAVGKTRSGAPEVRIMNIKDRTRITIPSPEASEAGFKIVKVENSRNYLDDSVVTLKKGGIEGEVRFDRKFLVLKKVAGPTINKGQRPGIGAKTGTRTNGRTGSQPPTPPGVGSKAKSTTPPKPGSVPQPGSVAQPSTSATATKTNSSSSSSKSKRTRYVPRPKTK